MAHWRIHSATSAAPDADGTPVSLGTGIAELRPACAPEMFASAIGLGRSPNRRTAGAHRSAGMLEAETQFHKMFTQDDLAKLAVAT